MCLRKKMGLINKQNIKAYDLSAVEKEIKEIYKNELNQKEIISIYNLTVQ